MVSSKKKRGKHRKAVVKDIVELVHRGDSYATHKIFDTTNTIKVDQLLGILSAVLGLLQRCEDETFDEVRAGVGGDFRSPSIWIKVLLKASAKDQNCRMLLLRNIGPLISCMCEDTERLFFKSNKYWKESIVLFVELILEITDKQTVDTILQHDGLLRSFVQWNFLGKEHRPDIVKMICAPNCATIISLGVKVTGWIIDYANILPEDGKIVLETIATTPIVSKSYDPSCVVPHVVGWIRRMKAEEWDQKDLRRLDLLFAKADCVDKDVITEVVDFGLNYTSEFDCAAYIATISNNMVIQDTHMDEVCLQSDTRIACAIRAGLIEMCLSFIERFVRHASFQNELSICVEGVLNYVNRVLLHKKTWNVIWHKRNIIEKELLRLG